MAPDKVRWALFVSLCTVVGLTQAQTNLQGALNSKCKEMKDGEEFYPKKNDRCLKCVCKNGKAKCKSPKCNNNLDCEVHDRIILLGECCPICRKEIQSEAERGENSFEEARPHVSL
ncbi:kielin/chordin-like protein [Ruditapes philippinarum]|uniref:kielin/chordin-like protein n=1 Tax=Ruditapes philippinarum TaxID=129788 RepID=UPI00295B4E31|nr:kielin/chordin-like protein [Ruditapes philippinarum]